MLFFRSSMQINRSVAQLVSRPQAQTIWKAFASVKARPKSKQEKAVKETAAQLKAKEKDDTLKRKNKIYNVPKPCNSYIRFHTKYVQAKGKGAMSILAKESGSAWKKLSSDERAEYEEQYKEAAENYKLKKARVPKRPANSYGLFMRAHYASLEDKGEFGELGKAIAEKWRAMSQSEKEPYRVKATHEMVEHKKKVTAFETERAAELGFD